MKLQKFCYHFFASIEIRATIRREVSRRAPSQCASRRRFHLSTRRILKIADDFARRCPEM
jgi:hypothetical protein